MSRKFVSFQIDALEALVEQHKSDRSTLLQIDTELSFRRIRKRNTELRSHIAFLLKEIADHKTKESKSTASRSASKTTNNKYSYPISNCEASIQSPNKPSFSIIENMRIKLAEILRIWLSKLE